MEVPSLERRYRSFALRCGNKNGILALLRSQAFQRGVIRRNPSRDDKAGLKSLEEMPSATVGKLYCSLYDRDRASVDVILQPPSTGPK